MKKNIRELIVLFMKTVILQLHGNVCEVLRVNSQWYKYKRDTKNYGYTCIAMITKNFKLTIISNLQLLKIINKVKDETKSLKDQQKIELFISAPTWMTSKLHL